MAEGLRLLGSCPKCDSVLEFRDADPREARFEVPAAELRPVLESGDTAPHLVLGIPRR